MFRVIFVVFIFCPQKNSIEFHKKLLRKFHRKILCTKFVPKSRIKISYRKILTENLVPSSHCQRNEKFLFDLYFWSASFTLANSCSLIHILFFIWKNIFLGWSQFYSWLPRVANLDGGIHGKSWGPIFYWLNMIWHEYLILNLWSVNFILILNDFIGREETSRCKSIQSELFIKWPLFIWQNQKSQSGPVIS